MANLQRPLAPASAVGLRHGRAASNDGPHNECADKFPPSRFAGMDVSVKGIRFDALQVGARVLWEIKTHQFDTCNGFIRDREIEKESKQLDKERTVAMACGYDFVIGVQTMTPRERLGIIVYAPALVGKDRRALDSIHGMEKALPGLRLEWRLSKGGRPIALPQRDAWLVESIEDGGFPLDV